MDIAPDFDRFATLYGEGRAQVVSTTLAADLETPVSAMLKLADRRPYSFLLESVEGGAVRGRYSLIGLKPDLIWRVVDGRVEVNRDARADLDAFVPPAAPVERRRRGQSGPRQGAVAQGSLWIFHYRGNLISIEKAF